mgnify:CR=1 FL=1
MTKQELEINCKFLEKRLKRIYEICSQYPHDIDGARAIGEIEANCDPNILANFIIDTK